MNLTRQKLKRQRRVRAKVKGSNSRPRLSVYRSNKSIELQLIDDIKHVTLLGMKDSNGKIKGTKTAKAKALGVAFAKLVLEKKIKKVIFDKGSYAYHGRVKAVATGAREGGLEF